MPNETLGNKKRLISNYSLIVHHWLCRHSNSKKKKKGQTLLVWTICWSPFNNGIKKYTRVKCNGWRLRLTGLEPEFWRMAFCWLSVCQAMSQPAQHSHTLRSQWQAIHLCTETAWCCITHCSLKMENISVTVTALWNQCPTERTPHLMLFVESSSVNFTYIAENPNAIHTTCSTLDPKILYSDWGKLHKNS